MLAENFNKSEAVSLSCTVGSSDKVYQVSLRAVDNLWTVEFAYGRRGTALKTGTKTEIPLDFKAAKFIFDKLIKLKMSDGYVLDQGNFSHHQAEASAEYSGFLPQLPIALDEGDVAKLMHDDSWWLQRKADGENRQLVVCSGKVRGINRKGLYVDIPQDWKDYLSVLPDCRLAGEACGSIFYAFDLLDLVHTDVSAAKFHVRFAVLELLIADTFKWFEGVEDVALANRVETEKRLRIIPVHMKAELKQREFDRIRDSGQEGVVFKAVHEPFSAGKSTASRKFKFVESATCIVLALNRQRSVEVGCMNAHGIMESLGNVSIPSNHEVPSVGELVEVRYMYRFEDGCFEQAVYLGVRTDLEISDAVTSQITRIKAKMVSTA